MICWNHEINWEEDAGESFKLSSPFEDERSQDSRIISVQGFRQTISNENLKQNGCFSVRTVLRSILIKNF